MEGVEKFMPERKPRKNSNFMKSIQAPVVWAIAILFGAGIIWWSVAQYLGGNPQNNPQNDGNVNLQFSETTGGLTKDGTPLSDPNYWVTYAEYETSVRDTLTNFRNQGYNLDPYFESENNPSEMGIRYEVFRSLINQKTLLYYANQKGVVPSSEQINSETDRIVNQYTSDENTKAAIISQYGSVEEFSSLIKNYVAIQLLEQNVREKAMPEVEKEFQTYVEENMIDLKDKYERVDASHILVTEEASALELKSMIESGELPFSQAASEFSIDTGTAIEGGSLGEFGRGQMVQEFEDAAFSATPGVLVGPVQSQFGYHLIEVATSTTFNTYEDFKKLAEFDTELAKFENEQFNTWIKNYRQEENFSYQTNDPDLQLYDRYVNSNSDPAKSLAFMEELERDYFDNDKNVLVGDSYLPLVFYTELVDSYVSRLRNEIMDLEDLENIMTTVPSTITSLSSEELASKLETTPATDTQLRNYIIDAQRMNTYIDQYEVSEIDKIQETLSSTEAKLESKNQYFERSVRYLYSIMPNSSRVINYMYSLDGNDPKVAYVYNENIYNTNVRPLLENRALLDSYLQYYGQYFGPQAITYLIDSPVQSIESDLNRKIINSTDAATEIKINALYLLVDIYEKLANIQDNEQMMEIYLRGERQYLQMLQEIYPEDATIKSMLETVQFQITELASDTSFEASETVTTPEATEIIITTPESTEIATSSQATQTID